MKWLTLFNISIQSISLIFWSFHFLKTSSNWSFLYFSNKKSQLISFTFLIRTFLIVTHLFFLPPQTVRVVIWWWRMMTALYGHWLLYVDNFHFLIDSLFCVFLIWLIFLITFTFLPNWCVSFRAYFKRFDRVLWPWFQTT